MRGWLEGDVALITGGASGLGRALVQRFIDEGAQVVVLDKSAVGCASLRAEYGDAIEVVEGDATSLRANVEAVTRATELFGKLNTVIANTGIWDYCVSLEDLPDDERLGIAFDDLMSVNVKSYLMAAKASFAELRASHGSLILTGSPASSHPGGGGPLYVASKHAIVGLVRQLAYEWAPSVRVNGIAPGGMISSLRGPEALGLAETTIESVPMSTLSRYLSPLEYLPDASEYTGMYVAIASRSNAAPMTGSFVEIDGGERVRGRWATHEARRAAAREA